MTDVFRGNSLFPGTLFDLRRELFSEKRKNRRKIAKKIEIMKKRLDLYET